MNISREIAPHLPYLRRFARALCGSQKSGDAYVVATLEALIADIDAFPPNMSAKVGLYHLFMRSWSSITLNVEDRPEDEISPAERNVSLLTPRSRQAFLLRTVEGLLETRARRARTLVDRGLELLARRTSVVSREDTRIDGKRVLLG